MTPSQRALAIRRQRYAGIIARAFERAGLPVSWGMALAHHESRFRCDACNLGPGDDERGGAWGLFQMTLKTARELGHAGSEVELLEPEINAALAAKLLAADRRRLGDDFKDLAAAYNSGRKFSQAPRSTREVYVPSVLALLENYDKR